jgi:hypothetical protein
MSSGLWLVRPHRGQVKEAGSFSSQGITPLTHPSPGQYGQNSWRHLTGTPSAGRRHPAPPVFVLASDRGAFGVGALGVVVGGWAELAGPVAVASGCGGRAGHGRSRLHRGGWRRLRVDRRGWRAGRVTHGNGRCPDGPWPGARWGAGCRGRDRHAGYRAGRAVRHRAAGTGCGHGRCRRGGFAGRYRQQRDGQAEDDLPPEIHGRSLAVRAW